MLKHKFNKFFALASTMAMVAGSVSVYAQEPVEEILVTSSFRNSVLSAIDAKRNADVVVEAISADDLGVLPDVSIADALSRLPGVSLVRAGGQAGMVNIRGMGGEYVHSTLNGREQTATSGSRKIEFDQYPSELISEAAVYKSPKASLIEGGVAGTVELRTANPLNNDKDNAFHINARGSYNDRADSVVGADEYGYRLSTSWQGKFADDTIGVALGYSRLFQPYVNTQFVGLSYTGQDDLNGDGANEYLSEGFEMQQKGGDETRDGFMGTLVWQPSDAFTLKGDVFYSEFESEAFARGFRVKTLNDGIVTNPVIQAGGAVTGGTITRDPANDYFTVQTTNDDESRNRDVLSTGLNATWQEGPWTVSADISRSEANGDFINGVSWGILFNDINSASPTPDQNISVDYLLNGLNVPQVSFSNPENYLNLDKMGLSKVGVYPFKNKDVLTAYKTDVKFEFDNPAFISSVEFGARYSERHFSAERGVFEYGNDFGLNPADQPALALTPDDVEVIHFSNKFANFPSFLAIDLDKVLARNGIQANPVKNWNNNWTMIQTGDVYEDVLAAYVQANLETSLFDRPLTGNLGVRMVETDQSSNGYLELQGAERGNGPGIADDNGLVSYDYQPVEAGKKFTDWLPSLNLNYHLTDNDQLRFAAAKVMARAPLDKLKSGGGSWVDGGRFNVWGNTSPLLDPFYATQADLSYEHYFSETHGALVIALFYKDVESYVENITYSNFDFAAAGIFVPTDPNTNQPFLNGEYQTARNNTDGGYIRGVELGFTQTLDFLPGAFSGLGFTTSYSYTESSISKTNTNAGFARDVGFPGLSRSVFNGTLFYDYQGFSTRVSVRYKEAFVGEEMMAENPMDVYYGDETVVDYQASYTFDSGINLVFQINNVTDEPTTTYFGSEAQTGTLQYYGRQMFLGVNYSF
ncbi:TonB-dependent receptor [Cellvibrio polysaccharolyticus]|uniref:TonB-dependent receptor n=1 Tax=Cellvibrio polysaccharolyticus TaxID=2082724 RepID=A0A928YUY8_9GAMM|nr:TonB-dependent receptor [Cellvibrio polysaccharolyticus]MBE8718469.1 TonB-dependent receptor [Cellvibrio polysaccharolyticus]